MAIDMGERQPKDHEAAVLGAEFGWPAEGEVVPAPTDQSAIIAAIDRLTAAVMEQGRQQQAGLVSLAGVLGEVMHALGGLPTRMPDGSAGRSSGRGR